MQRDKYQSTTLSEISYSIMDYMRINKYAFFITNVY